MQITSLEQLQAIKQTEIVELPSFEDGTRRCTIAPSKA